MNIDQEQHRMQEPGYDDGTGNWIHNNTAYNHSHHTTPVHEYTGFSFTPYPSAMAPPRTTHHQLQPLVMPQWPSTLVSQSTYVPPIYPSAPAPMPVPVGPTSTPISATSTGSRTSSTPRKTLTDADRRRMCLYHEEHPSTKQTEIGGEYMYRICRAT